MEKQVLHKGQVMRSYLSVGTQILVLQGKLHLQYTPHDMGGGCYSHSAEYCLKASMN